MLRDAAGARPRCGSVGMLFASPKAANSSAGWAPAPPPGMRGSLIPADTEVTGQAPNRPAELGEVAFAVTRSRPRHRCHAGGGLPGLGPRDPPAIRLGVVPGCQAGSWEGMQPAGTGERQTRVCLFLEAGQQGGKCFLCAYIHSFPYPFLAHTCPLFAETFNLLTRNFPPQETVWGKKKTNQQQPNPKKHLQPLPRRAAGCPGCEHSLPQVSPGVSPGAAQVTPQACAPLEVLGHICTGRKPRGAGRDPAGKGSLTASEKASGKLPASRSVKPPSRRRDPLVTPAGSALITPGAKLGRAWPSCAVSAWVTNEPQCSLAPAAGPGLRSRPLSADTGVCVRLVPYGAGTPLPPIPARSPPNR